MSSSPFTGAGRAQLDDDAEDSGSDDEWQPRYGAEGGDGFTRRRRSSVANPQAVEEVEPAGESDADFPRVETFMDAYDWGNSVLGPREFKSWSPELLNAFSIILTSEFPAALYIDQEEMLVCWNDRFARDVVAEKHRQGLWGNPIAEVFPEIVAGLRDTLNAVFEKRQSFKASGYQALLERGPDGVKQEFHYDFSLGPLLDKTGKCTAIFNICVDVSQQVLLERRIRTLTTLASSAARAQSIEGVCHSITSAAKSTDLPWSAIYVKDCADASSDSADGQRATLLGRRRRRPKLYRLVATSFDEELVSGLEVQEDGPSSLERRFVEGQSSRNFPAWLPPLPVAARLTSIFGKNTRTSAPSTPRSSSSSDLSDVKDSIPIDSDEVDSIWPFHELSADRPYILVHTPSDTSSQSQSIIFAITTQSPTTGRHLLLGFFVAGLNEHRPLDTEYLQFFRSVGQQLETGLLGGRAREEDRKTAGTLKRLNYERVQFFQNTAHELRAPLTLILGPLEELVRAHTSTPSAAAAPVVADTLSRLSLITRNARRLHKLVNSILRFSSIEAGSVATHFAQQRTFGVVTRRLIECFEPLSSSTGIELCMERGLGLTTEGEREGEERTTFDRETEEGLREDVFVDVELWEQVVFNLISNAFKHTWSGAITCSMYEKMEDGKNGVRFDVADTGVGISKTHISSVFERFYRADNTASRSAEGTGIGLALVKELIRLHGGQVGVASTVDVGSTFHVWIPRGKDHLPRDRIAEFREDTVAEVVERKAASESAVIDRRNQDARLGVKGEIMKHMGTWATARSLAQDSPMEDPAPSSPLGDPLDGPTPLATPINLADDSYFPLVDSTTSHRASSDSSDSTRAAGVKRKLGHSVHPARPPSAKRIPSATWVSKPRGMARSPSVDSERSAGLSSGAYPDRRSSVLVVDDNADMREWVSLILRRANYDVVEAGNGREGLEILESLSPDLILSDVMMPLLDGIGFVRMIRKHPRLAQVPVILLSARSTLEDSVEGLNAGASDYLSKPFNVDDLLARVRVHCRLNRLRLQTAEVEVELVQQQARVEAKDQLLSLVGHQLRTPLSSIVGAVELMRKDRTSAQAAPQQELLETIAAGADALGIRIEQLLAVAGTGKGDYVEAPFDLDSAISSVLANHSVAAAEKRLDLFSIIGHVPPQVTSDERRLASVLDALLSNAVEFSPSGEVVLRVWMENIVGEEVDTYDHKDLVLCFAVSDAGPGISAELAQRIFQPFQLQDASSTRAHGGTGLGLALALHSVELAGGQISIESQSGTGSTFSCRWPIKLHEVAPSPTSDDLTPAVAIISTRPTLVQSVACTSSMYGWASLDTLDDFELAATVRDDYQGSAPLIFFVDERLVLAQPQAAKTFLARTSPQNGMSPSVEHPQAPIYAILLGSTSVTESILHDMRFRGRVAAPCYRMQIKAAVSEALNKRRRPSNSQRRQSNLSSSARESSPRRRGRLLIAEDNKINAKLLAKQLKMLGFAADEAEHGARVLDLINAQCAEPSAPATPDSYLGILMDLDMPVMSGWESAARVRALGGRFGALPILAVTANASPGHRDRCLSAGFDDFISKPVSIAQLTELLRRNGLF